MGWRNQTEDSLDDKVPAIEETMKMPVMTSDSAVLGDGGDPTTSIPWTDSYFDNKVDPSDLIAVFDYDRISEIRSLNQEAFCATFATFPFMIILDTLAIVQGEWGSVVFFTALFLTMGALLGGICSYEAVVAERPL